MQTLYGALGITQAYNKKMALKMALKLSLSAIFLRILRFGHEIGTETLSLEIFFGPQF